MREENKKVFVGLSGGVDSSVAAALLKNEGYDVTGVFIKVWQADFLPCTWREERRDAMRAAAHLDIPFLTLDLEKEYKDGVVDYMVREYTAGRVPNPDVMCNKHVKFGAFLEFARTNGADLIATGHYVRVSNRTGTRRLLVGVDAEKDQSYFLWTLTGEQLSHALFPVGHLKKSQVRTLAKKFGLPNAEKKDSQGLCFMGPVNMEEFLSHYIKQVPGTVVNEKGEIVGEHNGAMYYTIGQRHGFTTQKKAVLEQPYYVISKDTAKNILVVAHSARGSTAIRTTITVEETNDINAELHGDQTKGLLAQIRYHGKKYPVKRMTWLDVTKCEVVIPALDEHIAPGQSIVFYDNEVCLGGGVMGI